MAVTRRIVGFKPPRVPNFVEMYIEGCCGPKNIFIDVKCLTPEEVSTLGKLWVEELKKNIKLRSRKRPHK